jgi:hypothetical protein
MPAMAALAVHSGALGKTYRVVGAVNGQKSFGNVYVIAAAARGGGKSTVAGIIAGPLLEANDQLRERFMPEKVRLETRAELLEKQIAGLHRRAMKQAEDQDALGRELENKKMQLVQIAPDGLPLPIPTLIEGNCTSEALAVAIRAGDQALLSYSPEAGELLRVALGKHNKSQQGDFDLLLSGWSSEVALRNRVGSGRNNLQPTLSALWFAQPIILEELIGNQEAFERGLTARLLIFDSEIKLQHDDGVGRAIPGPVLENWHTHIQHLVKNRPSQAEPQDVICSPGAREVFRGFHNESIDLRRGDCADIEGELSRWRENAIRVSLNIWVADQAGGEITAEQAERGVAKTHSPYYCS